MTLHELSQLYHLNREIEMDQRRLQSLEVKTDDFDPAEIADLRAIIQAKRPPKHRQTRVVSAGVLVGCQGMEVA